MEIQKVVIPAAGLGTRFLPYTKTIPKEMLPLIHKPALQLIVEECAASSLKHIIVVSNKEKSLLTEHFVREERLQEVARERHQKWPALAELENLVRSLKISSVEQAEPLGLGHAIWLTRSLIQDDYFGICLPDDIIFSPEPGLAQLMTIARQEAASVIAVQEVPSELISSYGVVGIKKQLSESLFELSHLVEKPRQHEAPSNLAIVGRYILSPKVFTALGHISTYAHGELQLTDAISRMLTLGERVIAYKIKGQRYDIGTPSGWLKAIMALAWQHPVYGDEIRREVEILLHQNHQKPSLSTAPQETFFK
jgi:UTP--glucose-1-phosphate uridylyltransferase